MTEAPWENVDQVIKDEIMVNDKVRMKSKPEVTGVVCGVHYHRKKERQVILVAWHRYHTADQLEKINEGGD